VLRGIYRKMHIPDDPLYYEKFYFTPGDLGFKAFDTSAGKLGTLVCWTSGIPKALRLTGAAGASILFYPTAIGWSSRRRGRIRRGRNMMPGAPSSGRHATCEMGLCWRCDRVGSETGDIRGNSVPGKGSSSGEARFSATPSGACLRRLPTTRKNLLGEVDLHQLEDIRRNWPFLRDDASTVTLPSPAACSTENDEANNSRTIRQARQASPRSAGIPHARRVGAARITWLALAAFSRRLAGQVRSDPMGLCRNRSQPTRHERVDLIVNDANWEKRARTVLEKVGALSRMSASALAHRPRLDSRLRLHLPAAPRRSRRFWMLALHFSSMHGPSIEYKLDEKSASTWARPLALGSCTHSSLIRSKTSTASCSKAESIDVNGRGTLITTEECLLSRPNNATRPWIAQL